MAAVWLLSKVVELPFSACRCEGDVDSTPVAPLLFILGLRPIPASLR